MVNTVRGRRSDGLDRAGTVIALYIAVVLATLVALAVLSRTDPPQAPDEAWVHAVVVGVFAVLLPIRLHAPRRGSRRATAAVRVIATVLVVVNAVEALIPGLFPTWMRIEMVGIAVLMVAVAVVVRPGRR